MSFAKDRKYQVIVMPSGREFDTKDFLDKMGRLEFGNRGQIEALQAWEYLQLVNNLTPEQKADRYASADERFYYDYLEGDRKDRKRMMLGV